MTAVTEGIEALASTRVSIRPVGPMADQGFVLHAQVCILLSLELFMSFQLPEIAGYDMLQSAAVLPL